MDLYPRLAQVLSPLVPDLLFLHSASLAVRFEVIATGKVIYSSDDQLRTDFEYLISGEYLDFKYHLDMTRKELLETIKEEHPLLLPRPIYRKSKYLSSSGKGKEVKLFAEMAAPSG